MWLPVHKRNYTSNQQHLLPKHAKVALKKTSYIQLNEANIFLFKWEMMNLYLSIQQNFNIELTLIFKLRCKLFQKAIIFFGYGKVK